MGTRRPYNKICKFCGKKFEFLGFFTEYEKRQFCNRKCGVSYWGKIRKNTMLGSKNPNWRGGIIIGGGYENVSIKGKMYRRHRILVEKFIGRKLKETEHIHHLDGNKMNNDISNLKIIAPSEHKALHNKLRYMKKERIGGAK